MTEFDRGITLATERLLLRPFTEQDVPELLAAGRDPEIRRWMPWADQSEEQAREFCTRISHSDPVHRLTFAIEPLRREGDLDTPRCGGSIGLQRADWTFKRAEIGYWLAPWARGQGLVTEAVRAMLDYGFGKGLHRIELQAAVGNDASCRVAERVGFQREGVLREAGVLLGGARTDLIMFAMLRGSWQGAGGADDA